MNSCEYIQSNNLRGNLTEEVWRIGDELRGSAIALAVLQSIIFVIGVPWNFLVILTILKEKLFKEATNLLLLNLAVNDLLMLLVILPVNIISGAAGEFIIGNDDFTRCAFCEIGSLFTLFPTVSMFTIAYLSLDRFLYIYKPLRYRTIITIPRVLIIVTVTWVILGIIAILPVFSVGKIEFSPQYASCVLDLMPLSVYVPILVVVFVLPLLLIIISNVWVIFLARKHIKAVYETHKSMMSMDVIQTEKQRHQKEFHLLKVFGGLLCCNVISFLPLFMVIMVSLGEGVFERIPPAINAIVYILFVSQLAVHPIMETTLIQDVRIPLKSIVLQCCCCCWKKHCNEGEGRLPYHESSASGSSKCFAIICFCGSQVSHTTDRNSQNLHQTFNSIDSTNIHELATCTVPNTNILHRNETGTSNESCFSRKENNCTRSPSPDTTSTSENNNFALKLELEGNILSNHSATSDASIDVMSREVDQSPHGNASKNDEMEVDIQRADGIETSSTYQTSNEGKAIQMELGSLNENAFQEIEANSTYIILSNEETVAQNELDPVEQIKASSIIYGSNKENLTATVTADTDSLGGKIFKAYSTCERCGDTKTCTGDEIEVGPNTFWEVKDEVNSTSERSDDIETDQKDIQKETISCSSIQDNTCR